jgi:hypothetical protein
MFGLVPMVWVTAGVARRGVREATRLRFISVLLTWVGYHLSPWIAFLSGDQWRSSLLVLQLVDQGLLFSSFAMIALILGYDSHRTSNPRYFSPEPGQMPLPKVRIEHMLILTLASLIVFLILVGGPSEAWASSSPRGFGQFEARDSIGKLRQMAGVLSSVLYVAAAAAAVCALQCSRKLEHVLFGLACLMVTSFQWMWGFSRGAGAAWAFLGFWTIRTHGRSKALHAAVLALLAFYMGWTGYTARGASNPGLRYYFAALLPFESRGEHPYASPIPPPERNPMNAMEAWTRKAAQREIDNPSFLTNALNFAWNLQPLPSELVSLRQTGRDLSEVMGTVGSTGITTPALAEIYYVFGLSGALSFLIFGRVLAWFDLISFHQGPLLSPILTTLCIFGIASGLHSSTRAMTRSLLYGFVLYCAPMLLRSRRSRRAGRSRPDGPEMPGRRNLPRGCPTAFSRLCMPKQVRPVM